MAGSGRTPSDENDSGGRGLASSAPIVVAVIVVVLALAVVLWLGWAREGPSRGDGVADATIVEGEAAPPDESKPSPAASLAALDRSTLPAAVVAYLDRTVYPPDSGRLDQGGAPPGSNPRYERFKRVPGSYGREPAIEFLWTADGFRYASDEVVEVRFEAHQGEGPALVRELSAWAEAEGRGGPSGASVPIALGARADAWTGTLDLSDTFADHHGFVVLGVRYTVADVVEQEERIRVFVTPATRVPAAFTGEFSDEVQGGSLVVDVGLDVFERGFYRIDASLHSASGEPLAWAAFKGDLDPGDTRVPLRFFGRTLLDVGVPGPYEVRTLRGYLFRDGEFPDRLNLREPPRGYTTSSVALAELSGAEWDGEHRRQMVQLLLEDVAAGRTLDVPTPVAAPGGGAAEAAAAP